MGGSFLNRKREKKEKKKGDAPREKTKAGMLLFFSLLFFFAASAVIGLRVFYPYHFFFSLPFLGISLFFFARLCALGRRRLFRSERFSVVWGRLSRHKKWVFLIFLVVFLVFLFFTIAPQGNSPFAGMSPGEREELIEADLQAGVVLIDNLKISGEDLVESPLLQKKDVSADEDQLLREKWNLFLSIAIETEKVTDVHRYFNHISYFSYPDEHAKSFVIAYALYMKKFELFYQLIDRIDGNERAIKVFNEFSPVFGSKGAYDDVLDRFFSSDTLFRRNLGRVYLSFLSRTVDEALFGEPYVILNTEARKSYTYLIRHAFNTAAGVARKKSYDLEKGMFGTWFPVQKNVANMMGNFYVSRRHEKLITLEQVAEMKEKLEPGDIFVERRNWYVSNVGIPGFWPHAALYIGTLEELEEYFSDFFPMDGLTNLRSLLESRHPELLKKYQGTDEKGFPFAVIEGKAPGIIVQSLEESAQADYLGVLRPRLSKEDKLGAILRSFENYGKPYDYNFDFETRDELVCSEFVYDAYAPTEDKKGLHFVLTITSGRKIVSPTDMVKKYQQEEGTKEQELDFVYFLDGNEALGKAFVKEKSAFATSWSRPKYSWFQE